jgi:tRNA-dihydrouridine synthase B
MAGITDYPFRMLCRSHGAELAFVEMINCRSISHKSKRTHAMLYSTGKDKPLGVQILGCEEKYILKALDVLAKYKFDLLDFNAACPAKKVVKRGEGSGLLKEPGKLKNILKLVVKNSKVPVTVKLRSGWDSSTLNAKDTAKRAEDAGVSAIFVHGRTRMQEYSGKVDYQVISEVKRTVSIPVIASGDIFSGPLAKKMFDETGCDGLAVARGALGNPWIFKEIEEYLKNAKVIAKPGHDKIVRMMRQHLDSYIDYYGEKVAVVLFRKFFAWYTKGFRKVRPLREGVSRAKTREEVNYIFDSINLAENANKKSPIFLRGLL